MNTFRAVTFLPQTYHTSALNMALYLIVYVTTDYFTDVHSYGFKNERYGVPRKYVNTLIYLTN
jgi:hypothetical protein